MLAFGFSTSCSFEIFGQFAIVASHCLFLLAIRPYSDGPSQVFETLTVTAESAMLLILSIECSTKMDIPVYLLLGLSFFIVGGNVVLFVLKRFIRIRVRIL